VTIVEEQNYLAHYGILRRSGRYPWGSGGNVPARSRDFLDYFRELLKKMTRKEALEGVGLSEREYRALNSIAKAEIRASDIAFAQRLRDKGTSNVAIGRRMGIGESQVRALLAPGAADKANQMRATMDMLKGEVARKKYIDVGTGIEQHLGITQTALQTAVIGLQDQGYKVDNVRSLQQTTGHETRRVILSAPGTKYGEIIKNLDNIDLPFATSPNGGRSYDKIEPPLSLNPDRVKVNFAEQGGDLADGVIWVRPGVPDLSLGESTYAQVRILVGKDRYIKGIAIYKDDLPKGTDLIFNTAKSTMGNKLDALKKVEYKVEDNPFAGTFIRDQILGSDGKPSSVMNIVMEEGKWGDWSRNFSSQFLSKQSTQLAERQLRNTYEAQRADLDDILSLTNPAVKRQLLETFAGNADSMAVHLQAKALPGTQNRVILPLQSLKDTQVYAPGFKDGDQVVLIRHPHGGKFELPLLTVNNRNPEGKKYIGDSDAVGIHPNVAKRLSGADFDGDTVLVVPNKKGEIRTSPALEGLKNFDYVALYPKYPGMRVMTDAQKQIEMGKVSNLITDMTIKGANNDEIVRAVKHSMVVIDAKNHELNWKESYRVNGIKALEKKFQQRIEEGKLKGGASTIVSRAKGEVHPLEYRPARVAEGGRINPKTGELQYVKTGRVTYKGTPVTIKSTQMKEARTPAEVRALSSGTRMENIYADHAVRMKALANRARKEMVAVKSTPYSPAAAQAYAKQVASLDAKLAAAQYNRPLERRAQSLANAKAAAIKTNNPNMTSAQEKRVRATALNEARARVGAKSSKVEINWDEWNAMQAGAVSNNKQQQLLAKANLTDVRQKATPKQRPLMNATAISRAKQMAARGYTQAEIADQLGVGLTTLKEAIKK
jgi:biotin operon repressor/DNA-binding CsgD family transcriptional regulator